MRVIMAALVALATLIIVRLGLYAITGNEGFSAQMAGWLGATAFYSAWGKLRA